MCLGIPGQVMSVERDEIGLVHGKVQFGGVVRDVNLSYTPEARVGDYVVVHVGFAISRVDEDEARRVFEYLEEIDALEASELAGGASSPAGDNGA